MICETIQRLDYIKSFSDKMAQAIHFLKTTDFSLIENGKIPIDGDRIYSIISSYQTRPAGQSRYETHRNYIDIQLILEGEENIFFTTSESLVPDGPYQIDFDKQNYLDSKNSSCLHLTPGTVAVFFPHDAHKACCQVHENSSQVRKVLIKVMI